MLWQALVGNAEPMPFGIAIEHYESDGAREVSFPLGVRRIGDEAFRGSTAAVPL